MQGYNQSQEQMLESIQHFYEIAMRFNKAISDVMYETNYCPVCKQHCSNHLPDCVWLAFQNSEIRPTKRAADANR
jgi:hypothetical protein